MDTVTPRLASGDPEAAVQTGLEALDELLQRVPLLPLGGGGGPGN